MRLIISNDDQSKLIPKIAQLDKIKVARASLQDDPQATKEGGNYR